MKSAHEATGGFQIGKWYPTTISIKSIEFERLLKPFKGYVSGKFGGNFSGFAGGNENA
jgi:hypothetical protein